MMHAATRNASVVILVLVVACGPARDEALVEAVLSGDSATVIAAIDSGADPDTTNGNGASLVMAATIENHVELLALLLQQGANPNVANSQGMTPLYSASMLGHTEATILLLDAGADPNVRIEERISTPLMSAAVNDRLTIVRLLLEHGADISSKNSEGDTVMELWEGSLQPEVRQLLNNRADGP